MLPRKLAKGHPQPSSHLRGHIRWITDRHPDPPMVMLARYLAFWCSQYTTWGLSDAESM